MKKKVKKRVTIKKKKKPSSKVKKPNLGKKLKKKIVLMPKVKADKLKKGKVMPEKAGAGTSVPASLSKGGSLEELGVVTHYFSKVEAAVVKLTKGSLRIGDTIIIKGHTTEFREKVDSIQLDHVAVSEASIGQEIGLRVKSKVREHDVVYKVVV